MRNNVVSLGSSSFHLANVHFACLALAKTNFSLAKVPLPLAKQSPALANGPKLSFRLVFLLEPTDSPSELAHSVEIT